MMRNFAVWLLAAALGLFGLDRYLDRDQGRFGTPRGSVHSMDDGAGQPPPPEAAP
jgi:hypothetical protein